MIDIQRRNKAIRRCFYEQLGKGMPVDDEAMGYRIWDALRAIGYWAMDDGQRNYTKYVKYLCICKKYTIFAAILISYLANNQ